MIGNDRIGSNLAYQVASQAIVLGLSLAALPYIIHTLGTGSYGLLILIGVTTNYFAFVELGLAQAAVRFIAQHFAARDMQQLRTTFWTCTIAYLLLSAIAGTVVVALSKWLVELLAIGPEFAAEATTALRAAAVGLVASMMAGMFSSVPRALERFDIVSRVNLAVAASQVGLNVTLLYCGGTVITLVLGGIAVQTVALLVYARVAFHLVPELGIPKWNVKMLREVASFSSLVSVSQLVAPVLMHLEKFIITRLVGVSALGLYTVPFQVVSASAIVPNNLAGVLFPRLSQQHIADDGRSLSELVWGATRVSAACVFPVVFCLVGFRRELLLAWVGDAFLGETTVVLAILGVALAVNAVAVPSLQALQAIGRPDLSAKAHGFELLIHVPVCWLLVSHYGIVGAAAAWFLRVLLDTVLLSGLLSRFMKYSFSEFIQYAVGRPAIVASAVAPVLFLGRGVMQSAGRIETLCLLVAIGGLYCLTVVYLSLGEREKTYFPEIFASGRLRLTPASRHLDEPRTCPLDVTEQL